ncbi:MAG: DUF4352 domain-containing protein [bacterium]
MPSFKRRFFSWQSRTVLQMLLIPIIFFVIFSLIPLTLLYFSSPGSRETLPTKRGVDQSTESIKIDDFALRINSIKISKELIKDSLSIISRKGYAFALINLTFENVGPEVKSCQPQVFLKDEEKYVYPEHRSSEIPRPFLFSVYPDEKRTGNYLFQIKKDRYPVELIISSLDATRGSLGRTIELNKNLIEHTPVLTIR